MIKIGIVTLFYKNHNYGAQLQAYALQKILSNYGYKAEQIVIDFENDCRQVRKERINKTGGILKIYYFIKYVIFIFFKNIEENFMKKLAMKSSEYEKFFKSIPHSLKIYKEDNIKESLNYYNVFICGSDVIWHENQNPYISSLGFVPDNILKISYGSSMGNDSISEIWLNKYLKYVSRLQYISVREKNIQNQLKKINNAVALTVDPVLLISKQEWEKLTNSNRYGDYILCYLLGDSYTQRKRVKEFAKKYGIKLITLPYTVNDSFRLCDWKFGDIQVITGNPIEFISLVQNAKCVITDSFHGVVFSIIFNKVFYAYKRKKKEHNCEDLNGRIFDFLNMLGLQNRIWNEDTNLEWANLTENIDYINVQKKLNEMIKVSFDFLEKSLQENWEM